MNLKLLTILLFSFNVHALSLGGVDVGNGYQVDSGFRTIAFSYEEELLEYGKVLLSSINAGLDTEAMALAHQGKCNLNNFQFKRMEIQNYYPRAVKERFSLKHFRAKIIIQFNNCIKPDAIAFRN